MTNQEMLNVLKGSAQSKIDLFNKLTEKVQSGVPMTDSELPVFEALKKDLFKNQSTIVEISASLSGSSGAVA
jgi:hypothetical protein